MEFPDIRQWSKWTRRSTVGREIENTIYSSFQADRAINTIIAGDSGILVTCKGDVFTVMVNGSKMKFNMSYHNSFAPTIFSMWKHEQESGFSDDNLTIADESAIKSAHVMVTSSHSRGIWNY